MIYTIHMSFTIQNSLWKMLIHLFINLQWKYYECNTNCFVSVSFFNACQRLVLDFKWKYARISPTTWSSNRDWQILLHNIATSCFTLTVQECKTQQTISLRAADALSASFICLFPTVSTLSSKCGELQTLSLHVSRKAGDFEEHTLSHTLSWISTQHPHTPVCLEDTQ